MGPESNRLQCGVRFAFPLHHRVCSLVRSPGIAQRPNCRLDGVATGTRTPVTWEKTRGPDRWTIATSSRLSGMSRNYLTGPTAPVRPVLLSAVTGSLARKLPAIIPLPPLKRRAAREKILKTDPAHMKQCLRTMVRTPDNETKNRFGEALTLNRWVTFKCAAWVHQPPEVGI